MMTAVLVLVVRWVSSIGATIASLVRVNHYFFCDTFSVSRTLRATLPHQLNLKQLKYFIAVAEELNFRRAAERLFITQPPLSRQIQMLEEVLGTRLFLRDRQGVRLTEAGNRFLPDARNLVQESLQAVLRLQPPGDDSGSSLLRLGITTVVDVGLFAGIESNFENRFPGVRVSVKRQISAHLIRDLHRGRIDVAVIGQPSRTDGLTVEHLCDDPMVACIPSDHRLVKQRQLSILDLADDPLFWFDRKLNPAYYDYCEQVFKRVGFFPQQVPEPTDHHVLLGLIAEGRGIALVPNSLNTVTRKGVVFKKIAEGEQLCIRIGAAYRISDVTAEVLALVAMLKERFIGST
jgi:DNA-binding transcriptional LysR family regulator